VNQLLGNPLWNGALKRFLHIRESELIGGSLEN
jgi:hypothetical protein